MPVPQSNANHNIGAEMRFIVRALFGLMFGGFATLSMEISRRYIVAWSFTDRNDDLISYARWETISWALMVVSVVVVIWAWLSTRNDN